ncbi:hypothetical protein [Paenibacillus medicaginis]|uniref:Uncharacterized protein n=1 Tax=Paenibacillus medicaginis TaxID=1470560 RepID=A0ABV5C137_9BACL
MKAEVKFTSRFSGITFFEVDVTLTSKVYRVTVNLSEMQRIGVTKSANGYRKVENWLNSEVGKKYLAEKLILESKE